MSNISYKPIEITPDLLNSVPKQVIASEIYTPKEGAGKGLLSWGESQILQAPDGQKHFTLNKVAYTLGGHIAGGSLSEGECYDVCYRAICSRDIDDEKAAAKTLKEALKNGMHYPLSSDYKGYSESYTAEARGNLGNTHVPFQEQNRPPLSCKFSPEVYQNLPAIYRQSCQIFTDDKEKEVYLIGALGNTSGILPNVQGNYGGNVYEANLYVLLLGDYGEGKSGLMYSRKSLELIHLEKVERSKELDKQYKRQLATHKKSIKQYEVGKITELQDEPTPPAHEKLFISANSSKTGIIQLLQENGGRGIIFEAEADTLADAIKQDYGNFSDVLRKAFGHEPINFFRRANNEDVEINTPCLSVVLSCTYDQLSKLIPSIENGLYSRFIYYCIETSPEFKNVFDKQKSGYSSYFSELGYEFQRIYNYLTSLTHPIWFELQPHQEQRFLKVFQEQKGELREFVSPAMGGTINRLGLICFRIAMQLATLRAFEDGTIPSTIVCSDQDFENALRITDTLKSHAVNVYWKLPKPKQTDDDSNVEKDVEKLEQKRRVIELHSQGMTYREISQVVFGNYTKCSTVYRWINGS